MLSSFALVKEHVSIKQWADDERPREKLMKNGKSALSNAELLAVLLSTGTLNKSALDLARDLLSKVNQDINELARLSIKDLCKVNGIGPAKAIIIQAAIELAGRRDALIAYDKATVSSSRDAYLVMKNKLEDLGHEEFWMVTLSRKNSIINEYKISEGGITATVVDQRKIFKLALDDKCTGIILYHNHPSGNTRPSDADNQLTRKLKEGGKILDINVLDHIIIVQGSYYSYADEGLM